MSTRSRIGIKNSDGTYISVYCHWDGHPAHHLPILTQHYNTVSKVDDLLYYGDMSVLDVHCTKPKGHTFETRIDGYTVYYGRDRGETKTGARQSVSDAPFFEEEYGYLFDGNQWFWCDDRHVWFPAKEYTGEG